MEVGCHSYQASSSDQLFTIFEVTKNTLEKMQRGEKGKRDSEDDRARSIENSMLISVEIWPVQSEVRERVSGKGGEPGRVEPGGEAIAFYSNMYLFSLYVQFRNT